MHVECNGTDVLAVLACNCLMLECVSSSYHFVQKWRLGPKSVNSKFLNVL